MNFDKKQRTDGQETRLDILKAASEIFASQGFQKTRNQDISDKAGTNSASVNYHFGSKENLYVEAWQYAFSRALEKYPFDGGVPQDAPAGERLYGIIYSLMQRIADPENYDLDFFHKESANPTGLLNSSIGVAMAPFEKHMHDIILELLGGSASEDQISLCHTIIMGMCFGPMMHLRRHRSGGDVPPHSLTIFTQYSIEEMARHVTRFSIDGITGFRKGV